MKLLLFLARYLRAFWAWTLVAVVATLIYAAATVFLLQLIEPILRDVLGVRSGEIASIAPAAAVLAPPPAPSPTPGAPGSPAGTAGQAPVLTLDCRQCGGADFDHAGRAAAVDENSG